MTSTVDEGAVTRRRMLRQGSLDSWNQLCSVASFDAHT
jgi:hypothetical protein